jgi:cysteine desulfurase
MRIYLDNAATTPLDEEVFAAMTPFLLNHFGNPSSHHEQGRQARQAIEDCRVTIANLISADPKEIIFTSGGTEADNTAILSAVYGQNINHVITSRFEHHAVLHTLTALKAKGLITISFVKNDDRGNLNLDDLKQLLQTHARSLVTIMHANNEIGNINNIDAIGKICQHHNALFHTDTVQTIGHYSHNLEKLNVHFLAASAHKFHGPKGVGFVFCRKGIKLTQLIHGGSQEGMLRAGTENIHGIVGMTKALQIAYDNMEKHQHYIQRLKDYMIDSLVAAIPGVIFNGNSANADKSLYTVLNVGLPMLNCTGSLLQYLDREHISVSGGSACSTGSTSHVLQGIGTDAKKYNIRFSFSKLNTYAEIDQVIKTLTYLYQTIAA